MKNDNKNETINSVEPETTQTIDDIDYDLITSGPLYVDPRHKKPGYVYKWVGDVAGDIDQQKRFGYTVVIDEFKVGSETASTTTKFGSAVTHQSKCGTLMVLMAITQELHDKYEAHKAKKQKERENALGKIEGVPDQYQQINGQSLGEYKIIRS